MSLTGELLAAVETGAEFWVTGDRLAFRIPNDGDNAGLIERLRARRAELYDHYSRRPGLTGPCRANPAQAAIYLQAQTMPGHCSHILRYPAGVPAGIDETRLRTALQRLAEKHAMLTARFQRDGADVLAYFPRRPTLELHSETLADGTLETLADWIERHSLQPMDLHAGPLCRFHLAIATGSPYGCLMIVVHHIVCDYLSMETIWRDLERYYDDAGSAPGNSAAGWHFSEFHRLTVWQLERSVSQRSWWQHQFATRPPPVDPTGTAAQSLCGFETDRPLDRRLEAAISKLATRPGVTPFTVFFAAFGLLSATGCDIAVPTIGVTTSGRRGHPRSDLVSCFVNTVPVTLPHLSADPTFFDLLDSWAAPLRDTVANDDVPFVDLVRLANAPRRRGRPALFSRLFTWLAEPARPSGTGLGRFDIELPAVRRTGVTHDLVLTVHNRGDNRTCTWAFDAAVFTLRDIEALAERYVRLLEWLLANPSAPLAAMPEGLRYTGREEIEI